MGAQAVATETTPIKMAEKTTPTEPAKKTETKSKRKQFANVWPEVWALVYPRRWILALGFLILIANRVVALALPASTKFLIDDVIVKKDSHLLVPIVLGVVVATLLQAATSFALTQLMSKSAWVLITELRIQVQARIARLPIKYYDANKTGTLVSRIMSDVEGVRNLIGTGVMDFVGSLLTAAFSFFILMRISPAMTLLAAAIIAFFSLGLRRVFSIQRGIYHDRSVRFAEITGRLTESLAGARVVKGYRAEERESAQFAVSVRGLLKSYMRSITASSVMSLSSTAVAGIVGALVMLLGAKQMLSGSLTLGNYVTYNIFLLYLIAPAFQLVSLGTQITEAIAGVDRTREVLREAEEDSDPRRTYTIPAGELNGNIRFENVSFEYEAGKPVLNNLNFEALPGTVTALVGPSGSGKSTIISLVSAFHNPVSGAILVDGVDLATVALGSYRSNLGLVLQESFLFDGSIHDNVAFARPDATREEVIEASRIARVDEFAQRFPEGYETVVGERGVKLSGGQRQRISIARAILADPKILILDEATSSLDSESEALIQEGLSYLMAGRTTFVIAHRLSTIRRADQILVIEDGLIRERGTHSTLLAARGRYYDLYTRQHAFESNLFLAPGEALFQEEETVAVNAAGKKLSLSSALRGVQ
jgi:ABC-type multidrug transport system fused ATPase/permease subunit